MTTATDIIADELVTYAPGTDPDSAAERIIDKLRAKGFNIDRIIVPAENFQRAA